MGAVDEPGDPRSRLKSKLLDALEEASDAGLTIDQVTNIVLACVVTALHGQAKFVTVALAFTQMWEYLTNKKEREDKR